MTELKGTSRVTVLPLLYRWPDRYIAVAYATAGHFSSDAIIGYVTPPERPAIPLMDIASRHQPGKGQEVADWLVDIGWCSFVIPKPGTWRTFAQWELKVDTSIDLLKPHRGHSRLHVGRFILKDEVDMRIALSVLPPL